MKKVALILGFLLAVWGVRAQEPTVAPKYDGAHMAFEKTEYDFGSIDHSLAKVECRFEFTNDGTEPLVITRTITSCNCIKMQYDKKPVPPGGKGAVTVIYEVNKKEAGVFYKVVEVFSNSVDKRNSLIIP